MKEKQKRNLTRDKSRNSDSDPEEIPSSFELVDPTNIDPVPTEKEIKISNKARKAILSLLDR